MAELVDQTDILFEVILNGIRIFPPQTEDDVRSLDIKLPFMKMAEVKIPLTRIELTKVEVEGFSVEVGAGGTFMMELTVFDPTMFAIDAIIYGVPMSEQNVEVTLGWRATDEKKIYKGSKLFGVKPEVVAGGLRYHITFIYDWKSELGNLESDENFMMPYHGVDDRGGIINGATRGNSVQFGTPTNLRNYWEIRTDEYDIEWDLIDTPFILTSQIFTRLSAWKLKKNYRPRPAGNPITIIINDEQYSIFTYGYAEFIDDLIRNRTKYTSEEVEKKWREYKKKKAIFTDFPIYGYSPRAHYEEVGGTKYTLLSIERKVATMRSWLPRSKVKYKARKFNNAFNIFHILFSLAAAYNLDVYVDPNLLKPGYKGKFIKPLLQDFIANKVVPMYWFHVNDFEHSEITSRLQTALDIANKEVNKYITTYKNSDEFLGYETIVGLENVTSTAAKNLILERSRRGFEYIFREVMAGREPSADIQSELFNLVSWDIAKAVDAVTAGKTILIPDEIDEAYLNKELPVKLDISFFNPFVNMRNKNEKIISVIKRLFGTYGYYYPEGLSNSKKSPLRLYCSWDVNPDNGKSVLRVSGEPKELIIEKTHMFTFPRQKEDGKVIDFQITSDKTLFLPLNRLATEKNIFNIKNAQQRLSRANFEGSASYVGEKAQEIFDKTIVAQLSSIAKATNDLYTRCIVAAPFISSVEHFGAYDLSTMMQGVIGFQRSQTFEAEMSLVGSPLLKLWDFIYVGIIKPDYTLHHLSGVYIITFVRQELIGAQYLTHLNLWRMSLYYTGEGDLLDGYKTFTLSDKEFRLGKKEVKKTR